MKRVIQGLILASLLVGCQPRPEEPAANSTPAPAVTATPVGSSPSPRALVSTPTPVAQTAPAPLTHEQAAAQNLPVPPMVGKSEAVLKASMVKGFASVYINDQLVGRYGKEDLLQGSPEDGQGSDPISNLVKPGKNTMKVVWDGNGAPIGEIHVSHSDGQGFRELASLKLDAMSEPRGEKSLTFEIPEAPAAAVPPTQMSKVESPRMPAPGSQNDQTLMTANIARGDVTVAINDKRVGSYSSGLVPLDVSNYVKSGQNTMTVTWKGNARPLGSIAISHAETANKFREVAEYDLNAFIKPTSDGPAKLTFNLP